MTLKQVYVGQVAEINPIDGADRLVLNFQHLNKSLFYSYCSSNLIR